MVSGVCTVQSVSVECVLGVFDSAKRFVILKISVHVTGMMQSVSYWCLVCTCVCVFQVRLCMQR